MNLLFCHDGPIEKNENNEYYGISFNDNLFKNYDSISNNISIAMRTRLISSNEIDENYVKLSSDKYKVIECPNIASIKGIFRKKRCYEVLKKAIKNTDVLIVRLPSFIGNLAIEIAKKYGKPYFVELVGCPWDSLYNHSFFGKILAPYMFIKTKYLVYNASHVLYVTQSFLQKRYPTKGVSFGCSDVMLQEIKENTLNRRLNKINNEKHEKMILGSIGNVGLKYKGYQYVIKAIGKLKKEGYNNFEYQIVGAGNSNRVLKIAKAYNVLDCIKIIGPLNHKKVFEWLDTIDIYIQPSKTEGMPRALIEAMSRGCPCIGSNVGGIPELLKEEYIFKSKKVNSLMKIIKSFDTIKMIRAAKENIKVIERYTNNSIIRQDFYNKFMGVKDEKK